MSMTEEIKCALTLLNVGTLNQKIPPALSELTTTRKVVSKAGNDSE